MILDEEVYLEHYGKKGMKWGTRRAQREQRSADRWRRVAEGTGNKRDKAWAHLTVNPYNIGAHGLAKASAKELDKYQDFQKKVDLGKYKVTEALNKGYLGYKISEIDYSYNKANTDKIKKKNKGAQVTLGILSTAGHLVPSAVAITTTR